MRKDVFGERKSELEEMVRAIGSPGLANDDSVDEEETDPSMEPPARTLTCVGLFGGCQTGNSYSTSCNCRSPS
ncbi:hypothetical protein BDV93DRAFT_561479 [Ceratobasidium sp. AG-I]|nr:hypothetical protein BDV93DRAFT_561479 [Ceratobasidium sp. AG-I]